MADPGEPHRSLRADPPDADVIKQRAIAGVGTALGRSFGIRTIGLLLNVFLARWLAPRDFGELALGLTIFTAFGVFASGGLGASLIRRAMPPEPDDLSTVFGAQLALSLLGLGIMGGLALALGKSTLTIAALFLATLPIQAPRTAALISLERDLDYKRLAIISVIDTSWQALLALAFVAAGLGAYGIALAQPLGAVVGTVVLLRWRVAPWQRPRLVRARARALLGDGVLFGASDATNLVRDLAMNWGTAAIAGVSVLGIWSFAGRLAAIPLMVTQAIGQVTYSAVPRLHASGGSAQDVVLPIMQLTAIGLGAPVLLLGACCPQFIPLVVGSRWSGVTDALPLMCIGILIGGPISVASAGYLFAHGRVRRILTAQVSHSLVAVTIAFSLLPSLGVAALGLGMCGASLTDAVVLGSATLDGALLAYIRRSAPLLFGTILVGAIGFACARQLDPSWGTLVSLGCLVSLLYGATVLVLAREDARRGWRFARSAFARQTAEAQ